LVVTGLESSPGAASSSVELPVTARLYEFGPKINDLRRLIEAFLMLEKRGH